MSRDPLETVLRLRRHAMEESRRSLADGLAAAAEADKLARAAERSIEEEAERASDPSGDDSLVEAFAAWLPGARHRATQARATHERLEAEVARRRAELTAARSGFEAITALLAERQAAAAQEEARRTQQAMDEAAARPRPDP